MPDIFDASKSTSQSSSKTASPMPNSSDNTPKHSILKGKKTRRRHRRQDELLEGQSQPARKHRDADEYSVVMKAEAPSRNPLNAFAPKPLRTFFVSQDQEEVVLLLLRKHPITQIPWLIIAFVLMLLPFLFSAISFFDFLPGNYQFAGVIGWYLLVIGFSLESFLSWFFNVYIITDERIIDVDFLSLIYKNVSAAKIDNIEDVTATTGGTVRALFHFGTVKIQTAAANREFEFEDVPHPSKVTRLINELILEEEREKIEGRVS